MRHNYIGEIENQGGESSSLAILSCEMINDADMAFILCDELGKTHYEKNFKLKRGRNTLDLNLPDLKKGKYNAWIQVQGKTFLRKLDIKEEAPKGLFASWSKLVKSYV